MSECDEMQLVNFLFRVSMCARVDGVYSVIFRIIIYLKTIYFKSTSTHRDARLYAHAPFDQKLEPPADTRRG